MQSNLDILVAISLMLNFLLRLKHCNFPTILPHCNRWILAKPSQVLWLIGNRESHQLIRSIETVLSISPSRATYADVIPPHSLLTHLLFSARTVQIHLNGGEYGIRERFFRFGSDLGAALKPRPLSPVLLQVLPSGSFLALNILAHHSRWRQNGRSLELQQTSHRSR